MCSTETVRSGESLISQDGSWRDRGALKPSFYSVFFAVSQYHYCFILLCFISIIFLQCPMGVNACPSSVNGSCNTGYTGVLCNICEPNYHMSTNSCIGVIFVMNIIFMLFFDTLCNDTKVFPIFYMS